MASTVTVTGKIGPGSTITSLVLNDVTSFGFTSGGEVFQVVQGSVTKEIDISAATTILITVSGSNYTVTIS